MKNYSRSFVTFLVMALYYFNPYLSFSREVYNWKPTDSAFKKYPIISIENNCFFILEDNTKVYIPDNRIPYQGWGAIGSVHVISPEIKPLPKKLSLKYFSLLENKFYKIESDLNIKKLKEKFKKGFIHPTTKEKSNITFIVVGMTLKGNISIWLTGENGETSEFITLKGSETNIPWSSVTPNKTHGRKKYTELVIKDHLSKLDYKLYKRDKLIGQGWNSYLQRRNFKLTFSGIKSGVIFKDFINGESLRYKIKKQINLNKKAMPSVTRFNVTLKNGKSIKTKVTFDSTEVSTLLKNNKNSIQANERVNIFYKLSSSAKDSVVFIKTNDSLVQLKKARYDKF